MNIVHHAARPHTHRFELPVDPDEVDATAAILFGAGALGLWERPDHLVAWFREPVDTVPAGGSWSIEPDRDWQADWKATIEPVRAGRFTVVPSWLAAEHTAAAGELVIVLDPGRAFGTGHHATTTQCLELLDAAELDGRSVADIGCGTGILAIAAAMRGAHAVAVDIDPDAVAVAEANAADNGVDVDVRAGSVEALPGRADVVVANLVTDVVVALAPRLVAASRDVLIVSGIATDRRARAIAALSNAGGTVIDVRERDGWVAIVARVPDGGTVPSTGVSDPRGAG